MSGISGRKQRQQQQQQPRSRPFKCVVVGDACVGKTCMVMRIIGQVPDINKYVPTIVENTEMTHPYRGQPCKLEICDTAGQEDYKHLRPASYSAVDLFLLCFCVVERTSFENLESVWLPELYKHQKGAKVLLVGTKLDLYKAGDSRNSVSRAEIDGLRGRHGNLDYVECSALTNQGIKEVLEQTLTSLHEGGGDARKGGRQSGRSIFGGRCDIL